MEEIPSQTISTSQPLQVIREILNRYQSPRLDGEPPFTGGFVGYFAYAMIGYAEPTLHISRGEANDYDLMLFDKVIAYDHLKQKIGIVVNMRTGRTVEENPGAKGLVAFNPPSPDSRPKETQYLEYLMKEYGRACGEIEAIASLINETAPLKKLTSVSKPVFTCNVSKEAYCDTVEKTKEYILDGDIFQAVISRQFSSPYSGSLLNAYRVLRTTNPSPYMVYMKMKS